jgi:hypothetical protein
MIVKCSSNEISYVTNQNAAGRVRQWVNSEGVYTDLEVGREYAVQNIEYYEGGFFYYLHSVEVSDHPYPYVAELFEISDSSLPSDWEISYDVENGKKRFKRLTFAEWAVDDAFFEKLIDGEPKAVSLYADRRLQ